MKKEKIKRKKKKGFTFIESIQIAVGTQFFLNPHMFYKGGSKK